MVDLWLCPGTAVLDSQSTPASLNPPPPPSPPVNLLALTGSGPASALCFLAVSALQPFCTMTFHHHPQDDHTMASKRADSDT